MREMFGKDGMPAEMAGVMFEEMPSYTGPSGAKSVSYGRLGSVYSPKGERVKETSAYGRVRFDIKNIIDGSFITKTKDIYCTLEINE